MWMLAMLGGTLAHADVVGPDATGCPRGSFGTSNHGGAFCAPRPECGSPGDEACRTDTVCEDDIELCVLVEERPCGGMTTPGEECTYTHREAFPVRGGSCEQGELVTASRCVEPRALGGFCATAPSGALGFTLLGLLPLLVRRRP